MHEPHWRFARMTPAEINQNPVQGEFFTAASDLPERFVREAIQNSLDAKAAPDEPVRVRFAFSETPLPFAEAERYLDGIERHLTGAAEVPNAVADDQPMAMDEWAAARDARELLGGDMPYLAVEDFGTTGLTGDIEANAALEEGNDFWGFFRSVGISPKGDDKGGSWGLGKWVFPDASKLNIFIGLTRREGDEDTLLMGQAVLKTHSLEEDGKPVKYPAYGSFATRDDAEDHEWLPLPEQGGGFVARARADFALQRGDAAGLSVIIPHPKPELSADALARAVLTQYFLPIVRGDLVVEIAGEGADRRIDAETIDDATDVGDAAHLPDEQKRDDESAESLRKAVALARWAISRRDDGLIKITATTKAGELLKGQDVESLRERYAAGEPLAFELSTNVNHRERGSSDAAFRVFIERDDELSEGHDYFVRGHLRIPAMDFIKRLRARALILVEPGSELGHLLRDAEGPAHVSWDPHAQRLKDRWSGGYERVQRVRRAAPLLLQPLIELPKQQLKSLLADLFPAELPEEQVPASAGEDVPGPGSAGGETPTPPKTRAPIIISNVENGFSVHSNSALEEPPSLAGSTWQLEFAYDVARGGQNTPFVRFKQGVKDGSPDFSLRSGELSVAYDGCSPRNLSENEIEVAIDADRFNLSITGFDGRDVVARFNQVSRAAADSEDDG